jgi:hypothetical protein
MYENQRGDDVDMNAMILKYTSRLSKHLSKHLSKLIDVFVMTVFLRLELQRPCASTSGAEGSACR